MTRAGAEAGGAAGAVAALRDGGRRAAESWATDWAGRRDGAALALNGARAAALVERIAGRLAGEGEGGGAADPAARSLIGPPDGAVALPELVVALAALRARLLALAPALERLPRALAALDHELDAALGATARCHPGGASSRPARPAGEARQSPAQQPHEDAPLVGPRLADFVQLLEQSTIPQALFAGDDLRLRAANATWRRSLGGLPALGRPLAEAVADGADSPVVAACLAAFRSGLPAQLRGQKLGLACARAGQPPRVVNARIYTLRVADPPGTPLLLLALDDITVETRARTVAQRAQRALEIERDNARALFAQAQLAVAQLQGPQLRYVYCNPAHIALLGRDMTGRTFAERAELGVPAATLAQQASLLREVMRTGTSVVQREERQAMPGGELYLRVSAVPHHDAEGTIDGVMVVATDVTQQAEAGQRRERLVEELDAANRRLRERAHALQQFRHAFEVAHIGMAMCDPQIRFLEVNRAFENITGYSQAELVGRSVADITHPLDRETATPGSGALQVGPSADGFIEKRYVHKSGRLVWVALSIAIIPATDDQPLRRLGLVQDITARKEHESREEAVKSELRKAIRARDDFLSIASHELKTPLTPLLLRSQGARRRLQGHGEARESMLALCQQVTLSVGQLVRLVDDMLDVSRLTHGKLSVRPEPTCLAALARGIVDRMTPEARAAQVSLSLAAPPRLEVRCDAFRLEQVMSNLINNALRYGGGSPVGVRLGRRGAGTVLTVSDQGPGIPEAAQAKIFERFERAAAPDAPTGLGLGLFICREIVERHGGRIAVRSRLGTGTTFTVWLPS